MAFLGTVPSTANVVASAITGTIAGARLPAGSVLQVVNIVPSPLSVSVAATGSNYSTLTTVNTTLLFSGSITPSSASSKIFIMFRSSVDCNITNSEEYVAIFRSSTCLGTSTWYRRVSNEEPQQHVIHWLDSPNTTSSVQYDVRGAHNGSSASMRMARSNASTTDNSWNNNTTLTLMEIAA